MDIDRELRELDAKIRLLKRRMELAEARDPARRVMESVRRQFGFKPESEDD